MLIYVLGFGFALWYFGYRFSPEIKPSKEKSTEQVPDPQVPSTDENVDDLKRESASPIKREDEGR